MHRIEVANMQHIGNRIKWTGNEYTLATQIRTLIGHRSRKFSIRDTRRRRRVLECVCV